LSQRLSDLSADQATAAAHAAAPITIGSRRVSREDTVAALGASLEALPVHLGTARRVPLGTYRGLRFGLVLHPQFPPDVYLEGAATRQSMLSRDHPGPRAVLNALERLACGYGSECDRVRQDLALAESQLRDYQTRLGAPFSHESYLSELTVLRDWLKSGLSGTPPEPGTDPQPSVAELAERIKSLKAAHSFEVAPQRTGHRRVAAEEPVTARIRRRGGSNHDRGRKSTPHGTSPAHSTPGPEPVPTQPEAPPSARVADERTATGPHSARVLADEAGQPGSHCNVRA
jgi:hypothetical protein